MYKINIHILSIPHMDIIIMCIQFILAVTAEEMKFLLRVYLLTIKPTRCTNFSNLFSE